MKWTREDWISLAVVIIARVLIFTLRVRIVDRIGINPDDWNQPSIWVFWHNRLLMVPEVWRRHKVQNKMVGLTSTSRDGAITEAIFRRFGVECVRGSSSKRGAIAVRELSDVLERGDMVAIVPDGPRGPRYRFQNGAIWLASQSGFPIGTLGIAYTSFWRLRSWDRFFIPKPFSKVTITVGPLTHIPPNLSDEEFAAKRQELEGILNESSTPE